MKLFVPAELVLVKSFCQLLVAFTNVSSAGSELIDAFDRLVAVFIFVQIESVSNFFSLAFRDAVNIELVVLVLVNQALIALPKSPAAGVKRVYWLAVPASGNVMRALGQTMAAVIAIAPEFFLALEPKN